MAGKRAIALILGLILGLGLLEAGLRLASRLAPPAEPPTMRRIPAAGPILSTWPPEGQRRKKVLVVGDSFTVGRGVALDEVYAARLADQIGREPTSSEVTSYSFPGWNTRVEASTLRRDLERLAPDVLIIGHCLNDAEKFPTARATADRPELRPWHPQGSIEAWLDRRSVLYSRVRRAADAVRLRPLLRDYYRSLYEDEDGARMWRSALAQLHGMAAERSIPAVLVIFPIFDSEPDAGYPYVDLHDTIRRTADDIGFEVLDLLPAYHDIRGRELALIPFTDPHPSARAHAIAGAEIAEFLLENNLL